MGFTPLVKIAAYGLGKGFFETYRYQPFGLAEAKL